MFKAISANDIVFAIEYRNATTSNTSDFMAGYYAAMKNIEQKPIYLCSKVRPAKWIEERWQGKTRHICSNCKSIGSLYWQVCPTCSSKEIVTVMMNEGRKE